MSERERCESAGCLYILSEHRTEHYAPCPRAVRVSERERCPECDRPLARFSKADAIDDAFCDRSWNQGIQECRAHAVDWRARCLAAEVSEAHYKTVIVPSALATAREAALREAIDRLEAKRAPCISNEAQYWLTSAIKEVRALIPPAKEET